MLLNLLFSGNIKDALITFAMWLPIILLAFSIHESAHALTASWLGDRTARNLGRVTLDPTKHLDLYGFISMLLFGIGWAKPVPIYSRNMKNPKWGMAISALAGPISNLLLGIIFAVVFGIVSANTREIFMVGSILYMAKTPMAYLGLFFFYAASLNISLAVFNMIPIPPFDGSRILYVALPAKLYFKVMKYEQYMGIAVLLIFLLLNRLNISPLSYIVDPIISFVAKLVGA